MRTGLPASHRGRAVVWPNNMATHAEGARLPPSVRPKALVVDDDEYIRPTLSEMLGVMGFGIVDARGGSEALALLASEGPFDLLLTDVQMPGEIDGADLAAMAKQLYPAMLIIVNTGFGGDTLAMVPSGVPILKKPFAISDLLAHIGDLRERLALAYDV